MRKEIQLLVSAFVLFLFTAFLFNATPAFAQTGKINGQVISAESGEPIPGANPHQAEVVAAHRLDLPLGEALGYTYVTKPRPIYLADQAQGKNETYRATEAHGKGELQ